MNVWGKLVGMLAGPPLWIGQVTAHNPDGTSTVQAAGGVSVKAIGQDYHVGAKVFYQGGRILADAPDLPYTEVTV